MATNVDYKAKFESFQKLALFQRLDSRQQQFVRSIAFEHRLTFQEFRQVIETVRDWSMWGEGEVEAWWRRRATTLGLRGPTLKRRLLQELHGRTRELRSAPKIYPPEGLPRPTRRTRGVAVTEKSARKIDGLCPVASEKTVCCNLRTIDAVENCAFGCSYCTIQTFYEDRFVFDAEFPQKLEGIRPEPGRFYHFCTGQSSDSLVWGNRNGILDALCRFAKAHQNVLLEFKTKSDNIHYLLENDIPPNIVCSWSLNTPVVIHNEEHFTASLEKRIDSARRVADRGIRVAFHFHPMIYYHGWEEEYRQIAATLLARFAPAEVLFVSFGSVTLIKPVIQQIRWLGNPTKILQMEMVRDPHGKFTYPDKVKIEMFRMMVEALRPWRQEVFMYLCMEKASIWEETFGFVYGSNDEFERDFLERVMHKIGAGAALRAASPYHSREDGNPQDSQCTACDQA